MAYTSDATRWRALATRDANANGHFIYTVRSTNIYCRPTCPARLARRANVGFYKTAFEAEANGFRACKRCKPDTVVEDPQERAVERACVLMDAALQSGDPKALRLQKLAKNVGLTPRYFHKIFKDKTGVTPKEWAKTRTTSSQSISDTTTASASSPRESTVVETFDWEAFNYSDFNNLVDFDFDVSATLGYNLTTGATEPASMGYGNAIDVNVLDEIWTLGYGEAGLLVSDTDNANVLDNVLADASGWPVEEKLMPAVSMFELDTDALFHCDAVLF